MASSCLIEQAHWLYCILYYRKTNTGHGVKHRRELLMRQKKQLTSDKQLVHYDATKELLLSCDASPYGIGAMLSHCTAEGQEQPIAFATRSLSKAEQKYAHLDKEGLAIVLGVRCFQPYLFGRQFIICSDHKPLQHIFSETRPIPTLASACIQRCTLTLSAYHYRIQYKPGKDKCAEPPSITRSP